MATTATATGGVGTPLRRKYLSEVFIWSVSLAWLIVLVRQTLWHKDVLLAHMFILPPWVLLLMLANLFPVDGWQSSSFAVDQPVTTAAALVLSPVEAGLIGFLGALDPREFRGRISVSKAFFNRTQVALPTFLGSWIAHHFVARPSSSLYILPGALLVLGTGSIVNYLAVATAISLERRHRVLKVLQRLRLGIPLDFSFTLIAGAVLGAMLATLYDQIHPWALLGFAAPLLLGRQVLFRSQMFLDARRAYSGRQQALLELTQRISEERSDERKLIAADLHDEVLQPLFKVTLMAQVLKGDLASGRLLEIDEDLPELLTAAELASSTLRELIGDLRRSGLGVGGLERAIGALAKEAAARTGMEVQWHIDPLPMDALRQLVLYQIAKEALGNAIQHSEATRVRIELASDSNCLRLMIQDNGRGFDTATARERHFGLQIMRERAASIDADLFVDSDPGHGCVVTVLAGLAADPEEHGGS